MADRDLYLIADISEGDGVMKMTRRSFTLMALTGMAGLYLSGIVKGSSLYIKGKMKGNAVKRGLVVWYSQAGNTERIGKLIAETLKRAGVKTDSGDYRNLGRINPADYDLIIAGSPVYYYESPENFIQWIRALPALDGTPVASFVTFGGPGGNQYNSAYSILELLSSKGGVPAGLEMFGAMSTFAPTWSLGNEGRILKYKDQPDQSVYARARKYALDLVQNVNNGKTYEASSEFTFSNWFGGDVSIRSTKLLITGHKVNREKCTGCGTCIEKCPVDAISLEKGTVNTGRCIACIGCVNNCPSGAIEMKFMGKKVYGFKEFLKRNNLVIKEPEEFGKL